MDLMFTHRKQENATDEEQKDESVNQDELRLFHHHRWPTVSSCFFGNTDESDSPIRFKMFERSNEYRYEILCRKVGSISVWATSPAYTDLFQFRIVFFLVESISARTIAQQSVVKNPIFLYFDRSSPRIRERTY